jgi:GAF domain-containing protein
LTEGLGQVGHVGDFPPTVDPTQLDLAARHETEQQDDCGVLSATEAQPFTERQVALLQTFANQAVIAIENVRLFKELEARTQELTRSVGELRALGEVSAGGTARRASGSLA